MTEDNSCILLNFVIVFVPSRFSSAIVNKLLFNLFCLNDLICHYCYHYDQTNRCNSVQLCVWLVIVHLRKYVFSNGLNILHAISISCFFYRFLVNFKCIKVNLPHYRALNKGVHVIVDYCLDALDFNLSKSNIFGAIFLHLTRYDKNNMAILVTWAGES